MKDQLLTSEKNDNKEARVECLERSGMHHKVLRVVVTSTGEFAGPETWYLSDEVGS